MKVCRFGYVLNGCSLVLLLAGCTNSKSVKDIKIDDDSAGSGVLQLNYHHSSGRNITQLEYQKAGFSGGLNIQAATDTNGKNEERLRNTNEPDLPQHQFIGVGPVKADYDLQQVSLRHIFRLDANGRFQIDLAPELALLQLESKYSVNQQHLSLDMDRLGAGLTFTTRWQFLDYLSLNFSGNHTIYEGDTRGMTHSLFVRFQPEKRFYIDFGRYDSSYDFGSDTRISYEQRVSGQFPCSNNCVYVYDGTENSDLEVDTRGFRLGLGVNF